MAQGSGARPQRSGGTPGRRPSGGPGRAGGAAPGRGTPGQGTRGVPSRVYVVRRVVALVVLLVVVAVVVLVVRNLTDGSPAEHAGTPTAPVTGPTTAPSPERTASADAPSSDEPDPQATLSAVEEAARAAGVDVCRPQTLHVTFDATAGAFDGGKKPQFAITITSTADDACLLEAGDVNRRVTITSGDDVVWSSAHCQAAEPESRRLLLGPGDPSEETYTWPRIRSAEGCPADLPAPKPGTYTATLTLDGTEVAKTVFDLR